MRPPNLNGSTHKLVDLSLYLLGGQLHFIRHFRIEFLLRLHRSFGFTVRLRLGCVLRRYFSLRFRFYRFRILFVWTGDFSYFFGIRLIGLWSGKSILCRRLSLLKVNLRTILHLRSLLRIYKPPGRLLSELRLWLNELPCGLRLTLRLTGLYKPALLRSFLLLALPRLLCRTCLLLIGGTGLSFFCFLLLGFSLLALYTLCLTLSASAVAGTDRVGIDHSALRTLPLKIERLTVFVLSLRRSFEHMLQSWLIVTLVVGFFLFLHIRLVYYNSAIFQRVFAQLRFYLILKIFIWLFLIVLTVAAVAVLCLWSVILLARFRHSANNVLLAVRPYLLTNEVAVGSRCAVVLHLSLSLLRSFSAAGRFNNSLAVFGNGSIRVLGTLICVICRRCHFLLVRIHSGLLLCILEGLILLWIRLLRIISVAVLHLTVLIAGIHIVCRLIIHLLLWLLRTFPGLAIIILAGACSALLIVALLRITVPVIVCARSPLLRVVCLSILLRIALSVSSLLRIALLVAVCILILPYSSRLPAHMSRITARLRRRADIARSAHTGHLLRALIFRLSA